MERPLSILAPNAKVPAKAFLSDLGDLMSPSERLFAGKMPSPFSFYVLFGDKWFIEYFFVFQGCIGTEILLTVLGVELVSWMGDSLPGLSDFLAWLRKPMGVVI